MAEVLRLRGDELMWREIEGEVVAVDLRGSVYLAGNPSAAALWPALTEGATREALAERLVAVFGISESVAARDVDAFIRMLDERELLMREGE